MIRYTTTVEVPGLSSHAHADHTANNDLIHLVQASETHHYLSEAGLALLDPFPTLPASSLDSAPITRL